MSIAYDLMKAEITSLTEQQRAELAHLLILSLDNENDVEVGTAWAEELARRSREIKEGTAIGRPSEQVFASLRARPQ
jgi:putative addiction module component (TIGR02574 family)